MIIVPDIHGRDFWKSIAEENDEIVFLGDYLDPYPNEGIDFDTAFQNFCDIIEFKKSHSNVTLLIGNHDFHYCSLDAEKGSRYDYMNAGKISKKFHENESLFQMALEKKIGDKRFIFSHAGITFHWLNERRLLFQGWTDENVVDYVNNAWKVSDARLLAGLNSISFYRGGYHDWGSMVWADIHEFTAGKLEVPDAVQIFGHTQSKQPINLNNKFFMLDCHKCFKINENGDVCDMSGKKIKCHDEKKITTKTD